MDITNKNLPKCDETSLNSESFPHLDLTIGRSSTFVMDGQEISSSMHQSEMPNNFSGLLTGWREKEKNPEDLAKEVSDDEHKGKPEGESKGNPVGNSKGTSEGKLSKNQLRNLRRKKAKAAEAANSGSGLKDHHPGGSGNQASGSRAVQKQTDQNRPNRPSESKRKRNANDSTIPSTSSDAKRRDNKATPDQGVKATYSKMLVEATLVKAIALIQGGKLIPVTPENYQKIFGVVNETLMALGDDDFMPSFDGFAIKRNVIRVVCECPQSMKWLDDKASELCEKTGLPLIVRDFDQIPWPKKFLVFFPFTKESNDNLLRLLNRSNRALPDIEWEVVRRNENVKGVHLLVKVEEHLADLLRTPDGTLKFGVGKVRFTEFKPKPKSSAPKEIIMDTIANETSEADEELSSMVNMSIEDGAPKTTGAAEQVATAPGRTTDLVLSPEVHISPEEMLQLNPKGGSQTSPSSGEQPKVLEPGGLKKDVGSSEKMEH